MENCLMKELRATLSKLFLVDFAWMDIVSIGQMNDNYIQKLKRANLQLDEWRIEGAQM